MTPINGLQRILQGSGISLPSTDNQQIKNTSNNQNQNTQNVQQPNQDNQSSQDSNSNSSQDLQKQVQEAIAKLTENLSYLNTHLNIQIDSKVNTVVVKIIDNKTNQVIKEIPPEYMLKIAEAMNNLMGIFVNKKV